MIESVRSKISEKLFNSGLRINDLAIRGYVRGVSELTAMAEAEPADWFIAHTHPALPVAAAAARRWKSQLGFDCEDLLAEHDADQSNIVRSIERRYLPVCDYVSVPSRCLGDRLAQAYSIPKPLVLYNVFPSQLADSLVPPKQRPPVTKLRLHWFGQTIGSGRGLEEAIEALGMMEKGRVELHLRGRLSAEFRSIIDGLARRYDFVGEIVFHEPVDQQDLIGTLGQFDVGLSLERPEHGNYSLAATNKLFSYLLAGLAVAATDTPGHREILDQIPSAGFVYPAHNPQALADALNVWLADHDALRSAQEAAWDVARRRFCWDIEKDKFLSVLQSVSGQLTEQPAYA